jgi:threonine dehydratase
MFTREQVEAAQRTVYAAMPPTPQYAWPLLQQRLGFKVWVKHENHTPGRRLQGARRADLL